MGHVHIKNIQSMIASEFTTSEERVGGNLDFKFFLVSADVDFPFSEPHNILIHCYFKRNLS